MGDAIDDALGDEMDDIGSEQIVNQISDHLSGMRSIRENVALDFVISATDQYKHD
ncbi:hypothetical protein KIN20_000595 [Parelaphostrongylus tenuis]|uniref:Uncharacterized protein n=1 Tax=Parelaphostrongylus tenuis TaxID=148309 RepID=A0AAD5MBH7_PARTN|nr:hypothetical protein KIN20_000595 [Parelaphostrongylus tenuis]